MRALLRMLLRLFPDDVDGILRGEMEETFMDGYRRSPSPFWYAYRELWGLLRNGAAERVRSWSGESVQEVCGSTGPVGASASGSGRSSGDGILSALRCDVRLAF